MLGLHLSNNTPATLIGATTSSRSRSLFLFSSKIVPIFIQVSDTDGLGYKADSMFELCRHSAAQQPSALEMLAVSGLCL